MSAYWTDVIHQHGRKLLFLDSSAILGTLEQGNEKFGTFFNGLVGYTYVTSTYVVAETVRRLVKSQRFAKFMGPSGERRVELSKYVIRTWLTEHGVSVLCIPEDIFNKVTADYCIANRVQCDLTDLISFAIVRGLQQNTIVTDDGHFRELGLQCLPD